MAKKGSTILWPSRMQRVAERNCGWRGKRSLAPSSKKFNNYDKVDSAPAETMQAKRTKQDSCSCSTFQVMVRPQDQDEATGPSQAVTFISRIMLFSVFIVKWRLLWLEQSLVGTTNSWMDLCQSQSFESFAWLVLWLCPPKPRHQRQQQQAWSALPHMPWWCHWFCQDIGRERRQAVKKKRYRRHAHSIRGRSDGLLWRVMR